MKKRKILSIASTTACLLWLTACGGSDDVSSEAEAAEAPASDEVITLKVGHIAPPEEAYALGFDAYAEAVEEATDGRVQFQPRYLAIAASVLLREFARSLFELQRILFQE